MITSHLLEDSPSLATTYSQAPAWGFGTSMAPAAPLRFGLIDWREDLDIVFGVVFTLLGVASAVAAMAVQW
ncbi:MAG: hypothetical protein JWQ11_1742 [Rhizobacter sp.]|nr:hypothetical protein [Rhizobacter sp.]